MKQDILLTTFDSVARWAQSSSVWPLTMGLACCAIEMMTATAPEYDLARLGSEVFRASPRQADLMIVSGRVAQKMAPVVRRLWEQMADPKWVISMGACASSGGVFDNYAILQGVDSIIPVDVYIPGCPPTPDGLIYGVNLIQQQIRQGGRGGVLVRS
jgi:NADH-quinone oxidoreductase subunit B